MSQEGILDAMWAALREATNDGHHFVSGPRLVEAAVYACLHLVAVSMEHLSHLLG